MAADPDYIQNWIAENGPYLYHGAGGRDTYGDPMNILREGIVPRTRPNDMPMAEDYDWTGLDPVKYEYPDAYDADMDNWWHMPRPGHTYLVTDPEAAYGHHLFRIDMRGLDPQHMNPDDDYLRETGKTIGPLLMPGVEYRDISGAPFKDWDEVRKNLKTLGEQAEEQGWGDNVQDTHNSLEAHPIHPGGMIAYRGTIPPHLIEHVGTRDDHHGDWQMKTSMARTEANAAHVLRNEMSMEEYEEGGWGFAGDWEDPNAFQTANWGPIVVDEEGQVWLGLGFPNHDLLHEKMGTGDEAIRAEYDNGRIISGVIWDQRYSPEQAANLIVGALRAANIEVPSQDVGFVGKDDQGLPRNRIMVHVAMSERTMYHIAHESDAESILAHGLVAGSYLWSNPETASEFAEEYFPEGDWVLATFDVQGLPLRSDPEFDSFGEEGTLAWICDAPIGPERIVRRKTAMANRTGDPELDALLERFMREEILPAAEGQGQTFREYLNEPNVCGDMSSWFHDWLYRQGMPGWSDEPGVSDFSGTFYDPDLTGEKLPHPWTGSPMNTPEEHGYGDRRAPGAGDHEATLLRNKDGCVFLVDWAAGQYGYRSYPMVQRLNDSGSWDRQWTSSWVDDQRRYDADGTQPQWRSQHPRVPKDYALDLEWNCYGNAENLAKLDPSLSYVEGHARTQGGQWGEHAWTVTPEGEVVDPYFEWKHPGQQIEYRPADQQHTAAASIWDHEPGVWYHVTSADRLPQIMREGLRPDTETRRFDHAYQPGVYLFGMVGTAYNWYRPEEWDLPITILRITGISEDQVTPDPEMVGDYPEGEWEQMLNGPEPWWQYEQVIYPGTIPPSQIAVDQDEHTGKVSNWYENPDIADFQHGLCDTYAKALLDMYPHLRLGTLQDPETNNEDHYFAHDDQYAYDSLGRHPLPYRGLEGWYRQVLDDDPADYGIGSHYPYGENGGPEDYERAKALIPHQHPWLNEDDAEPRLAGLNKWSKLTPETGLAHLFSYPNVFEEERDVAGPERVAARAWTCLGERQSGDPRGEGEATVFEVAAKNTLQYGGVTLRGAKLWLPTAGYLVALASFNMPVAAEELTGEILERYYFQTEPDIWGTYLRRDGVTVDLDHSVNILEVEEALSVARANNQEAIWDVVNKKNVYVDKRSASYTADEIIDMRTKQYEGTMAALAELAEREGEEGESEDDPDLALLYSGPRQLEFAAARTLWKQAEWTLDDVQEAQKYVTAQLGNLITWQGVTAEQANTAILDELHDAEMPEGWAKALLVEAWRVLRNRGQGGRDNPATQSPDIQPLSPAQRWRLPPGMNDWRLSSEGSASSWEPRMGAESGNEGENFKVIYDTELDVIILSPIEEKMSVSSDIEFQHVSALPVETQVVLNRRGGTVFALLDGQQIGSIQWYYKPGDQVVQVHQLLVQQRYTNSNVFMALAQALVKAIPHLPIDTVTDYPAIARLVQRWNAQFSDAPAIEDTFSGDWDVKDPYGYNKNPDPRLGAAPRNVMVGEYRDGVIRLNEHSHQWFNANYFKRLWLHSYPKYPFKELHVDHGEKPLHIPLKGDTIPPGGLEYDPEQVDTDHGGAPQEGEQAPGQAELRQDLRESRQAARSPMEAPEENVTSKWRINAKEHEDPEAKRLQEQGLPEDGEDALPSAEEDAVALDATPFTYDSFDLDDLPDRDDIARAWQHAVIESQDPWDTSLVNWDGVDQWVGQFGNAAQNVSYGAYRDIFDFAADAISKMQRLQVLGTAHKRTASTLGLTFLRDSGYIFPNLMGLFTKSKDDDKDAIEEEFIHLIEGFSDSSTHRTESWQLADFLREQAVEGRELPEERQGRWQLFSFWRTLSEARI